MRVSSPIGDLPFEPRRVRLVRGGVELEGAMGAWPARVRIDASDLPALARSSPPRDRRGRRRLGVATASTADAGARRDRRSDRHDRRPERTRELVVDYCRRLQAERLVSRHRGQPLDARGGRAG